MFIRSSNVTSKCLGELVVGKGTLVEGIVVGLGGLETPEFSIPSDTIIITITTDAIAIPTVIFFTGYFQYTKVISIFSLISKMNLILHGQESSWM